MVVDGFGLKDAFFSYGLGIPVSLFGFPFHFDWSRLTDLSTTLPGTEFDVWVGSDF